MNKKGLSTQRNFEKILCKKEYAKNTISIYLHYVAEFIDYHDKTPTDLTKRDLVNYLMNYKYSSISQQNQVISALKKYYSYILKIKRLDDIALERPRGERKLPRVIDHDHIIRQISKISNIKHKAIIMLAYSVGLRVGEIINLEITHIDSGRMVINILNAKGRKDRVLPLSENVLEVLRKYYHKEKPFKYLFNGQGKLQYSSTSCNNIVKKYLGENYHFHLLRHSCFTHLLESGTDLRLIQTIAGHKSSKTTEIYTHVSRSMLQNIPLPV
ncbi:MAG: tyrosine-type recombinase/integrase [Salinivirgaceae bacterium]|jgi:integrase/recombinase XerD|nr:tyrosine-type recombinase/integrase [Salinivirgaceae bacterium]